MTVMLELDTIPPCTLNGMVVLFALTFSPSSAAFVLSVRIALPGLLPLLMGTRPPAAPVSGSGSQRTAAGLAAAPVPPGTRLDRTRVWPESAVPGSPALPKHFGYV